MHVFLHEHSKIRSVSYRLLVPGGHVHSKGLLSSFILFALHYIHSSSEQSSQKSLKNGENMLILII